VTNKKQQIFEVLDGAFFFVGTGRVLGFFFALSAVKLRALCGYKNR
jgi:hypothetical protein